MWENFLMEEGVLLMCMALLEDLVATYRERKEDAEEY